VGAYSEMAIEQAMSNSVEVKSATDIMLNMDDRFVKTTLQKANTMQAIIQNNLIDGTDYGTIKGCGEKKCLFKGGAEKINMLFGTVPKYEIEATEDYDKPFFAYRITCTITHNGLAVSQGVGIANCRENKYKNQDRNSIANTILKMAKKRAFVDATLQLASLSNLFTQDLEDIKEVEVNDVQQVSKATNKPDVSKAKTASDLRKQISDMLVEVCNGDRDVYSKLVKKYTNFENGGVDDISKVSDKGLPIMYGLVKEKYKVWKDEQVKNIEPEQVETTYYNDINDDELPFDVD